jgi:hypothetical protein
MTEDKQPDARLTKSVTASTDGTNPRYENKSASRNTQKNAIKEFILNSKRKFQAIRAIAAVALGCHVIAAVLEYFRVDTLPIGTLRFIEYAAVIGDAVWIVVLIVCEVCNAITEMLTGRFKKIVFCVAVFAAGAVLSPHIRDALLLLLQKVTDVLEH